MVVIINTYDAFLIYSLKYLISDPEQQSKEQHSDLPPPHRYHGEHARREDMS